MLTDEVLSAIQVELQSPVYADAIASQDWARLSYMLDGALTGTRQRPSIGKGAFSLAIAMSAFRIAELPDIQQRKWDRVLSLVLSNETIDLTSPQVQGMLNVGVSEGVITQAEVDAILREPCTRIEAILGRSVLLSAEDVQAAASMETAPHEQGVTSP